MNDEKNCTTRKLDSFFIANLLQQLLTADNWCVGSTENSSFQHLPKIRVESFENCMKPFFRMAKNITKAFSSSKKLVYGEDQ